MQDTVADVCKIKVSCTHLLWLLSYSFLLTVVPICFKHLKQSVHRLETKCLLTWNKVFLYRKQSVSLLWTSNLMPWFYKWLHSFRELSGTFWKRQSVQDKRDQSKKSGDSLEVWIMCFRAVYITIIYSYLHGNEWDFVFNYWFA